MPAGKAAGVTISASKAKTAFYPVRRARRTAIVLRTQTLRFACKRCVGLPSWPPEAIALGEAEVSSAGLIPSVVERLIPTALLAGASSPAR